MAGVFFPLDEELGLLPKKQWTPRIQEAMTRLGAKLPFREAAQEVRASYQVTVSEATTRQTTHENGRAAVAVMEAKRDQLQAERPIPTAAPQQVQLSADGCFICTTSGEWREVKTVAIGEVATSWNPKRNAVVTETTAWSYYSSTTTIRDFEENALVELHQRGVENAQQVFAVNDGAIWIQNFTDYHCPDAIRILDFSHAAQHVAAAGKAALGDNSEAFKCWYRDASALLKQKPPTQSIARLHLLASQADDCTSQEFILDHIAYLEARLDHIDYPFFLNRHYPIGSGSVESSHKHVVQKRMKQAGMRWRVDNIDPMLSLRNLLANDRWDSGWLALSSLRQAQHLQTRFTPPPLTVSAPLTFDMVQTLPEPPSHPMPYTSRPSKPASDHPWRNGFWPDPRFS